MKSPRDLKDVYTSLGMPHPDVKEREVKTKAKAFSVEQESERLQQALTREAVALPHFESLATKLAQAKEDLALAQQAVDQTLGAINAADSDKRRQESQVTEAMREYEALQHRLSVLSGQRVATGAEGEIESTKDADALKKMDRKQVTVSNRSDRDGGYRDA